MNKELIKAIFILPGSALVFIPGAILWLAANFSNAILPAGPSEPRFYIGIFIGVSGLAMAVWTVRLFVTVGKGTPAPWAPPKKLVVRGPYRHTRNPMITAVIWMIGAEALLVGSWPLAAWMLVFYIVNAIYFWRVEEPGLERRFGEGYRRYKANVPRWGLRVRPWDGPLRLLLLAPLAFLLAAPGLHADVLRRGTNDELPTFDPQYIVGNSAGAIMYDLFEGLVSRSPDGTPVLGIAESWSVSEDGTVYTFRLKSNAKWSDGQAITAGDFVYSYKRMLDPQSGTRGASALFPVLNATSISLGDKPVDSLGVKAVDPLTLEITLEGPAPYFISLLASYSNAPVPSHVIEKYGRKWTQPGNMVTNGAYMVNEVVTNTYYRLVRNPHYHSADQVSIDEVIYYPVPSTTTSLKRYLAGELDVILNIPLNQYENLRKTRPEEFRITPGIGLGYLSINNTLPPFDDVRVRKALSLSIDREVIVEKLLKTGDEPAHSVVPTAIWGSSGELPAYSGQTQEQRLAQARSLLNEAGFNTNNPLKFTFLFSPLERDRRLAVAYRSMWQQAGVEAELETAGMRALMKKAAAREYQVMRLTYYAIFYDPVSFFALIKGDSFRNYSGYSNADINRRLAIADTIRSDDERTAYLREIEQRVMQDFPVIPSHFQSRAFLVNKRVKGWTNSTAPKMAKDLELDGGP